jgi:hypothetical protein
MWCDLEHQWGGQPGHLAVHSDLETPPAVGSYGQAVARKIHDVVGISEAS